MTYSYIGSDGNKNYKEVLFPGLIKKDEEKYIFKCYNNHKFIPKFLDFSCDQEEGLGILLEFLFTLEKLTIDMT